MFSVFLSGRQLGPVVRSLQAAAGVDGAGLSVSLLERFIDYNTACAKARRIAGLAPATGTMPFLHRQHQLFPNKVCYKIS